MAIWSGALTTRDVHRFRMHEGECLPVVVTHDEARRGLFDGR